MSAWARLFVGCSIVLFSYACARDAPKIRESDAGQQATNESQTEDVDGGATEPPPPSTGAFAGAPPYKGAAPDTRASTRHVVQVTGADCMQCHGIVATPFTFAGTAVPGAEIRVVDANEKEIGLATADADGNFWSMGFQQAGPMRTGIRSAKGAQEMFANISAGGCNATGCHDANRKLVVP